MPIYPNTLTYADTDFANGVNVAKLCMEAMNDPAVVTDCESVTHVDGYVHFHFFSEPTSDDQDALDVIIANHIAETLQDVKDKRQHELRASLQEYVLEKYPIHNQTSYLGLLLDAAVLQSPPIVERIGYIGQALTWMGTAINWFYVQRDIIQALTTKDDVRNYQWSFAYLDSVDPLISLEGAMLAGQGATGETGATGATGE